MNDFTLVVIFSFGILILICLYMGIKPYIENNTEVKFMTQDTSESWVLEAFEEAAMQLVANEFSIQSKPIVCKNGQYRADYQNAVHKRADEIYAYCTTRNLFSNDFCKFVQYRWKLVLRKHLHIVIYKYSLFYEEQMNQKLVNSNSSWLSLDDFFDKKSKQIGDCVGCYVLYNTTKHAYYVGQATRLYFRVNQHFTGHGNGDVYADYKYGDTFRIMLLSLSENGYSDLDKFEADLIKKYDAFNSGYNKTRGNYHT